jgi:hypothetical protein
MQEYEIGDRSTDNYDFMKEKLGDAPIEGYAASASRH